MGLEDVKPLDAILTEIANLEDDLCESWGPIRDIQAHIDLRYAVCSTPDANAKAARTNHEILAAASERGQMTVAALGALRDQIYDLAPYFLDMSDYQYGKFSAFPKRFGREAISGDEEWSLELLHENRTNPWTDVLVTAPWTMTAFYRDYLTRVIHWLKLFRYRPAGNFTHSPGFWSLSWDWTRRLDGTAEPDSLSDIPPIPISGDGSTTQSGFGWKYVRTYPTPGDPDPPPVLPDTDVLRKSRIGSRFSETESVTMSARGTPLRYECFQWVKVRNLLPEDPDPEDLIGDNKYQLDRQEAVQMILDYYKIAGFGDVPPDIADYECWAWEIVDDSWQSVYDGAAAVVAKRKDELFVPWGWHPWNRLPYVNFPERGITGRYEGGDYDLGWTEAAAVDSFWPELGHVASGLISVRREYSIWAEEYGHSTSHRGGWEEGRREDEAISFSVSSVPKEATIVNPYSIPADVGLIVCPTACTETTSLEAAVTRAGAAAPMSGPMSGVPLRYLYTEDVRLGFENELKTVRLDDSRIGFVDGGFRQTQTIAGYDGLGTEAPAGDDNLAETVRRDSLLGTRSLVVFNGTRSEGGQSGWRPCRDFEAVMYPDGLRLVDGAGTPYLMVSALAPQACADLFRFAQPQLPEYDLHEPADAAIQTPLYGFPSSLDHSVSFVERILPIFDFGAAFGLTEASVFEDSAP